MKGEPQVYSTFLSIIAIFRHVSLSLSRVKELSHLAEPLINIFGFSLISFMLIRSFLEGIVAWYTFSLLIPVFFTCLFRDFLDPKVSEFFLWSFIVLSLPLSFFILWTAIQFAGSFFEWIIAPI